MNNHLFKNFAYFFLFLIGNLFVIACKENDTKSAPDASIKPHTTATKSPTNTSGMNPKYPHIPMAEKGITVVNPNGWKQQDMEFHIGYCKDMFAEMSDLNGDIFCHCFLEKIQYYYEPIYFKEAYNDQQKWNAECLEKAKKK